MKRNSKFLLVLSMMIFTLGLFMVGCDDTTVEPAVPIPDKVVGSIEGVVWDANTHAPLGDLYVAYWSDKFERDSVMTLDDGSFVIEGPLPSGTFTLVFSYYGEEEDTYAVGYATAVIPNIDDLKGDIDVNPSGEYHYRAMFVDNCETDNCLGAVVLFHRCVSVNGQLWSALPDGADDNVAPKSDDNGLALQQPPAPIIGVKVILTYPQDCGVVPLIYETTTDNYGIYTFNDLPEYNDSVYLTIPPFPYGDSSYQQFDTTIGLVHCEIITVPDIYGIVDCRSVPTIMSYNFDGRLPFNYYDNLVMYFSEPMDTAIFRFTLHNDTEGEDVVVTYSWNQPTAGGSGDSILTIDPHLVLETDDQYTLTIDSAFSISGCPLAGQFTSLSFRTEDGIALFSTNAEVTPGNFSDFQIEDDITIEFTMPPVIDPIYGTLTLTDITTGIDYSVAFDSSVSGNVLTVDPRDNLEMSHTYEVCYKMFSSIPGDFVDGCFEFETEIDTTKVIRVTGWAINADIDCSDNSCWRADWNTTTIPFKWNKVDRAQYYLIYAYDNSSEHPNTDFIKIDSVASQDHLQFQEANVEIPAQFDRYSNDSRHTPFTDNTTLWFMVRAGNAAGLGPHSDTIDIKDTTPPGAGDATNDNLVVAATYGSGDNTAGAYEDTVWISLSEECEYFRRESNPVWDFVEAGGDESYVLPDTGIWLWSNDSRRNDYDGSQASGALFTVPAGQCGAGDSLYMTFYDNSGNDTTVAFRILPYINFTKPLDTSSNVEASAAGYTVTWSTFEAPGVTAIANVDMLMYYNAAILDSIITPYTTPDDGSQLYALHDTLHDAGCRFGLRNNDGGVIWWSDVFTHCGINMLTPDSATYFNDVTNVYDRSGYCSTAVAITWTSDGLDSVGIWYSKDGAAYVLFDSLIDGGTYDFYPPDFGEDYECNYKVADFDADIRPMELTTWYTQILHDSIEVTAPDLGDEFVGGLDTNITWNIFPGIEDLSAKTLKIEYSYDAGADTTWVLIDAATPNDSLFVWSVPANTPSNGEAMIRVINSNDSDTLFTSALFSITGLTVTTPVLDDEWQVGSVHAVTWDCQNATDVGNVIIWASTDGFVADSTNITGGETANDGSWNWSVNTAPSATTTVRIWGVDQDVYATSDVFIVAGMAVVAPNGGETWTVGATATITWTEVGTIATVDIAYSVNDGGNWTDIVLNEANDGSYTWAEVANVVSDGHALVRIRDNATALGSDASDAVFDIAGIVISAPNGAENWANGTTHNIVWTQTSTMTGPFEIHYSLDGSDGTYYQVPGATSIDTGVGTFAWIMNAHTDANLATSANCWVRIQETGTGTVWDKSALAFTISNIAPVANAGADQSAHLADVSWNATVSDPDGGIIPIITWAWGGATPTGTFTGTDDGAGTMTFAYTYNAADDGLDFTIDVTANDGLTTHVDAVVLHVEAAPVVAGIPGETIAVAGAFATIDLDDYCTDADHVDADQTWTYTGDVNLTIAIDGVTHVATITHGAWTGTEVITFIATDPDSNTDNQAVTFIVTP